MRLNLLVFVLLVALVSNFATAADIVAWPAPGGIELNTTWVVQVKAAGAPWVDLDEYDAVVDAELQAHISFVYFDMDSGGNVEVRAIYTSDNVNSAKVRPDIASITPVISGDTVSFTLQSPEKVSLEINGDTYNNLFVFANQIETAIIDSTGPNMHYFGRGMHTLGDGSGAVPLNLATGDTVYIAGGAVVNGNLKASSVRDVVIMGHGILSGNLFEHNVPDNEPKSGMMYLTNVTNLKVQDLILLNTCGWNISVNYCDSAKFQNLKILSWTVNSDGINPRGSNHITIDDCLIRNDDDCISIKLAYGVPGTSTNVRGCHNILIQNCIFWADRGRVILFGPESFSTMDRNFDSVMVRNCDVLWCKNFDIDWARGVFAINCNDGAVVKNVTFEDLRVDAIHRTANLINIRLEKTPFGTSAGAGVQNINFNRVTLKTSNQQSNVIYGEDASHIINNVHFRDLKINGQYIISAIDGGFDLNSFTDNITFQRGDTYVEGELNLERDNLTASPNPFNPAVNIQVSGWQRGTVLRIFNVSGKVMADLTSALNSGSYVKGVREVTWNAAGQASGVYLVLLRHGNVEFKRKVLLIK